MLRTELRPYQSEAVLAALPWDGFAIFPEQRSGKTLVSLALVDHRKPDVLLVICPKKAIAEWQKQIKQHLEFDWKCQKVLVNYEDCSHTKEGRKHYRRLVRKWIKSGKTVYIILDEAHRIKKRGTAQSRMCRSLGKLCTWRLALTGTPIAQGIADAWAIFDFVLPDVAFGSFEQFKDDYLVMDTRYSRYSTKVLRTKNDEKFFEIFHKYSYRLTFREAKASMGLAEPKIRRRKVFFELEPETWDHYEQLEDELETYVNGTRVSTPIVLSLTMKLQQLCGGYLIQDEHVPGRRRKKRTVFPMGLEKLHLLERIIDSGEIEGRFVICCRFRHEIKAIAQVVEDRGFTQVTIAGGTDWDANFVADCAILQVQSAVAIDLSAAPNYIFYSWDFSYINYEQAKFRILSFETKQANYWYLMAHGTVDEDIYEAVVRKKNLADFICDKYRKKRVKQTSSKTSRGHQGRAVQANP